MAGEIGGRARILRRTIAQAPAGNISLNDAQAYKILDRATLGIDVRNPSANAVRIYEKFPWAPAVPKDEVTDPTAPELLLTALGTDYRIVPAGETFHYEHIEFRELWMMAEGGAAAGVEITVAARQS